MSYREKIIDETKMEALTLVFHKLDATFSKPYYPNDGSRGWLNYNS